MLGKQASDDVRGPARGKPDHQPDGLVGIPRRRIRSLRARQPGQNPEDCACEAKRQCKKAIVHPVTPFQPIWCSSVPIFEMAIRIRSPAARYRGGFRKAPTPAGVPVAIMSPGSSVSVREM